MKKTIILVLLCMLLSIAVNAQEQRFMSQYENAKTSYASAQSAWKTHEQAFRVARSNVRSGDFFDAAKAFTQASIDKIIAHLLLVKSAVEKSGYFATSESYTRAIDEQITELEALKEKSKKDENKIGILGTAKDARLAWRTAKSDIIKPVTTEILIKKTDMLVSKLEIVIARLKEKQSSLKSEGVDTKKLDEALKKIESNGRRLRELVNLAKRSLEDAERLGSDSDNAFKAAFDDVSEAKKIALETLNMIGEIIQHKETYTGG